MKKLLQFLHHYVGCEMVCHSDFRPNSRESSPRGRGFCMLTPDLLSDIHSNRLEYGTPYFKPILRPASALTDSEFLILFDHAMTDVYGDQALTEGEVKFQFYGGQGGNAGATAEWMGDRYGFTFDGNRSFRLTCGKTNDEQAVDLTVDQVGLVVALLGLGIDLFGLIEKGLAVDLATITAAEQAAKPLPSDEAEQNPTS